MRWDFSFLMFLRRSLIWGFESVVGMWVSFFGRRIVAVGSVFRTVV